MDNDNYSFEDAYTQNKNEWDKPKEEFSYDKKDVLFIFLTSIFGVLFSLFVFFAGLGFIATLSVLVFYLIGIFYLKPNKENLHSADKWLFLPVIILTLCFSIFNNAFLSFINILLLLALMPLHFGLLSKHTKYNVFSPGTLIDWFRLTVIYPLANILAVPKTIFYSSKNNKTQRNILKAGLGILVALPIIIVIFSLLISADEAFYNLIMQINNLVFYRLDEYFFKVIFGIIIGVIVFTGFFSLRKNKKENSITEDISEKVRILDKVVVLAPVAIVCLLYFIYIFSQTGYFFSGFTFSLPSEFTYANYAVCGFGELVAIAVINLFIISISYLFTKRNLKDKMQNFILSVLIWETILLIISAFSKLVMYMNAFGLTLLRVYAAWFLLVIAILFIMTQIKILIPTFKFVKLAAPIILTFYIVFNLSSPDWFIAKYNVDRYLSNPEKKIDVSMFYDLSHSMIPEAKRLFTAQDENIRREAITLVNEYKEKNAGKRLINLSIVEIVFGISN